MNRIIATKPVPLLVVVVIVVVTRVVTGLVMVCVGVVPVAVVK